MTSPNLSEIVTTTLRNRSKKLADNVSDNNAILARLKQKGKIRPFSGGVNIVEELEYAENGTYKRYSGYEVLDIAPSDVFTAAEFDIKQAAVAVSISGLEQLQNTGDSQVIDLLAKRIANAERTFKNSLSADLYSAGTADGGKQIGGLQLLVADDPTTGEVGGINRANWTFWQNNIVDIGGSSFTSTNVQSKMNSMWSELVRGTDKPDLIICDNTLWLAYLASLQTIQRITGTETATAGFQSLKFMTADVVMDGGQGGNCPANHMYFLNTDYIHFRPHRERNMVPIGGDRFSTNQDAMVKLIGWAGNMTLSNAALQGVLFT
jgi:hypothetical protein